jgi:hypothetical protein
MAVAHEIGKLRQVEETTHIQWLALVSGVRCADNP